MFIIFLVVYSYCYLDTDFTILEFMFTSSVMNISMISMMSTIPISKSSKNVSLPENSCPITFFSLMENVSYILRMYKDVSGVYMLVSPCGRRYIGSSVDLGRRMEEYYNILKGYRKPKTSAERELSNCSDINVVFICFVPPIICLVEEQLAMFLFYPNMNTHLVAFPNFSHTHIEHGSTALDIAKEYRDYFPKESNEFLAFQSLIDRIQRAINAYNADPSQFEGSTIGKPVFVYNYTTGLLILVYNSVNACIQQMALKHATAISRATDHLVHDGNYVLSFVPLSQEQVMSCLEYLPSSGNTRFSLELVDKLGNTIFTFDSLRAMARHFEVDPGKVRKAVSIETEWEGLIIVKTLISRSKPINCYDANSGELITTYSSVNEVLRTVKGKNSEIMSAIKNNSVYKGRIYSYSKE